uniref:Uncharacterized protein n=1 Tax=Cannabis sativa TaxID=3483 RepID=A0A803P6Q8_CANSA
MTLIFAMDYLSSVISSHILSLFVQQILLLHLGGKAAWMNPPSEGNLKVEQRLDLKSVNTFGFGIAYLLMTRENVGHLPCLLKGCFKRIMEALALIYSLQWLKDSLNYVHYIGSSLLVVKGYAASQRHI